jgi:hypothetical protein
VDLVTEGERLDQDALPRTGGDEGNDCQGRERDATTAPSLVTRSPPSRGFSCYLWVVSARLVYRLAVPLDQANLNDCGTGGYLPASFFRM